MSFWAPTIFSRRRSDPNLMPSGCIEATTSTDNSLDNGLSPRSSISTSVEFAHNPWRALSHCFRLRQLQRASGVSRGESAPRRAHWAAAGAFIPEPPAKCSPPHPQIARRRQRIQLHRVPGQSAVAHLHVPELALNDPKRVPHLCPYAGLHMLELARRP